MSETKCKGCDKPIVWAQVVTNDGVKRIPLDPRPAVYELDPEAPGMATRNRNAMVTHFATCPKASDFSGGKSRD